MMSKEYIDKAAFIEYLGFENTIQEREENIGEIVTLEDFDRQPVADVVEVVRCKDCKYRSPKYDEPDGYYGCELKLLAIDLNGFCSEGERREK